MNIACEASRPNSRDSGQVGTNQSAVRRGAQSFGRICDLHVSNIDDKSDKTQRVTEARRREMVTAIRRGRVIAITLWQQITAFKYITLQALTSLL